MDIDLIGSIENENSVHTNHIILLSIDN